MQSSLLGTHMFELLACNTFLNQTCLRNLLSNKAFEQKSLKGIKRNKCLKNYFKNNQLVTYNILTHSL